MHDLDTALLRTFVTLADTHSFGRTGAVIGRSQPAVSAQLARLEGLVGQPLIARTTRRLRLTPAGEQLLPHARALVAQADAMLARFRVDALRGEVRFGAPEDFTSVYLADILGEFVAGHPQVDLHATCQLTLPLVEALQAGELDLIVVKQDPRTPFPGAQGIWTERLVWVGAGARALDDAVVPLVLAPAPCVYRARATGALQAAGRPWSAAFTSPSFAGAVAGVRAGLGVMVMPRSMVPRGLVLLDGWPALEPAEIALITAPRPSPAVTALADHVRARVRR
jgi:DNA-binding transcriptional LysR family regulator